MILLLDIGHEDEAKNCGQLTLQTWEEQLVQRGKNQEIS